MTDLYKPKLRQPFLDDMRIKGLKPKTQTMFLRAIRDFTRFLGHAPEELRAFQLDMKERGFGAPTFNNRLTILSFFFAATCPRPEMKRHLGLSYDTAQPAALPTAEACGPVRLRI